MEGIYDLKDNDIQFDRNLYVFSYQRTHEQKVTFSTINQDLQAIKKDSFINSTTKLKINL